MSDLDDLRDAVVRWEAQEDFDSMKDVAEWAAAFVHGDESASKTEADRLRLRPDWSDAMKAAYRVGFEEGAAAPSEARLDVERLESALRDLYEHPDHIEADGVANGFRVVADAILARLAAQEQDR